MDDYFGENIKSDVVPELCKILNTLSKDYDLLIDVESCISNNVKKFKRKNLFKR